jgi:hypothetical protein
VLKSKFLALIKTLYSDPSSSTLNSGAITFSAPHYSIIEKTGIKTTERDSPTGAERR